MKNFAPKMAFLFEGPQELVIEILSRTKLQSLECGNPAKLEKHSAITTIRCRWSCCRKCRSIWIGTIFEYSKIEKEKILNLINLWFIGLAPRHICAMLSISRVRFSRFIQKLKSFSIKKFYSSFEKIGGMR